LPAYLAIDPHRRETYRLVQADAGLVRQGDPGEGGVAAFRGKQREQCGIERAADPLPGLHRIDVDRDIARACVGCAGPMRRAVGIAGYGTVDFGDQPGVIGAIVFDPPRHFDRVWRLELEADPAVGDERRVYPGTGLGVSGRGGADHRAHGAISKWSTSSRTPSLS